MSNVTHRMIFQAMERWAPAHFAYDWDPIGLQVGAYDVQTTGVLVTLDVNEAVIQEATKKDVNVIIAHHPFLFKPLQSIQFDSPKGKCLHLLFRHEITVYASHTNLDIAEGGVNDLLANALQLEDVQPLVTTHTEKLYKVIVFTPVDYVQQVIDAMSESGAGHIGNYSYCTFQTAGKGTFKPLEGSNPFIGTEHTIESVDEIKVEMIVQETILQRVIHAMNDAHPYEEVAYDIIPLANDGKSFGIGRIGTLKDATTLGR